MGGGHVPSKSRHTYEMSHGTDIAAHECIERTRTKESRHQWVMSNIWNESWHIHSRILTLEARIRESDARLSELSRTQDLLKEREDDCQNLALKVSEQQNERHRAEDMLQLLQDKDVLLHDALKKNTALVSEIEQVCMYTWVCVNI